MKETDPKKNNRQTLLELLGSVSPGTDFSDEETLFGRILDDYGAYADLIESDHERQRKDADLEAEYRHNTAVSMQEIERVKADEGLDNDEVEAAIAELKRIASETSDGNYTIDNVRLMLAIAHRDADIETARREGEIAGRNATIERQLQADSDGDGLPTLAGGSNGASRRAASIFDIARQI